MKKLLILLAFVCPFLFSCSYENPEKESITQSEVDSIIRVYRDSIAKKEDSLFSINIQIPPLFDKNIYDSSAIYKFYELASQTNGELKVVASSSQLSKEIINIIESHCTDKADVLFLIDKTGSMSDDIENIKKSLNQIINSLDKYSDVRISIALYGDHNWDGNTWYSYKNFEKNYIAAKAYINSIHVTDGGDFPESVYEGFFKVNEENFWASSSKRMIILIGDAPPLEKPASIYSIEDVIKKAKSDKIYMNFYPIVVAPSSEGLKPKTFEKTKLISNLYPNPANSFINLNFEKIDDYEIEIFNVSGSKIIGEKISAIDWRKDISSLENGVYIIRVIASDKSYDTYKIIISK